MGRRAIIRSRSVLYFVIYEAYERQLDTRNKEQQTDPLRSQSGRQHLFLPARVLARTMTSLWSWILERESSQRTRS